MKNLIKKIKECGLVGLTLLSLVTTSCREEKPYGKVSVEELVHNPKQYHKKQVIVEGLPLELRGDWESSPEIFGVLIQSEKGDTLYVRQKQTFRSKRFPLEAISREIGDGDRDLIKVYGTFCGKKSILYCRYIQVGDTLYLDN